MGEYKLKKDVFKNKNVNESLEKYPRKGYQYLSFYTKYDENYFKSDEIYLFFNNVETWEDKDDRNNFIDKRNGKKCFVRCMNYQIDESVAMWKTYGYPNNIMIRFEGKELRNVLGITNPSSKKNKILNCKFKFKNNDEEIKVTMSHDELKIFDVLYYARMTKDMNKNKKEKSKYYVEKGTFNLKDVPYEQMKVINPRYLKRNAFSSEKETRLYFEFDEKTFNELFEAQFNVKEYSLSDLEYIKVILKFKDKKEAVKIRRIPKFLISKSRISQQNTSKSVQEIERIDNWDIDI